MIDATSIKQDKTVNQDTEAHTDDELRLLLASTLVEHFDPMSFGLTLIDKISYEQALAHLSESCEEVEHEGDWHWELKQDVRRDLLKQHYGSELFESVRKHVDIDTEDAFARYLQKGMNGHRLSDELTADEKLSVDLNALLKAARLIDLLAIPANDGSTRGKDNGSGEVPSEARLIRRYIEKKAAMDNLGNTAGERLFGRFRDVRTLIRYCNSDLEDPDNSALQLCVIIGVGGIGKSALLARYIFRQRNRAAQAPVIHFDFDRSSLKPDDPLALTFELTRQLALYEPDLDLPLVRFRRSLRTPEALDKAERIPDRALTDALSDLGDILVKWPGHTSGVTLVIDTFEEVALQGSHAVRKTLLWLGGVRKFAQLKNLHIIIAGREMPDSILSDHLPHILCRIRLSDLHQSAAQLMLKHSGISTQVAEKAVETFGGNPLVLRMFLRFYNNKPEEIDALLDDSRNQKRSAPIGKLAISFLFERILVRIPDEQIRKLTSPGLLLRHITADLIKNVLARPCDLGELNDEQAQALFERLAGHVWLVRQEGDRLLSHRRDLRRMMLPGIQKTHESLFEQINHLAVSYYTSEPEGVSPEEAWIEAAYHRGFLAKDPIPESIEEARKVITQLGSDLMDWPVHTTAMIKDKATPERLTEAEKRSLEAEHGPISRASQAALLEQDLTDQLAADNGRHSQHSDNVNESAEPFLYPDTQLATTESIRRNFKTGRFDHISPLAARLMKPLFRERNALSVTHYWQDKHLLRNNAWLVALSVLAEPDNDSDETPKIPPAVLDAAQATPRRVGMDTTFELFYMLAIAYLMQDRLAIDSLSSFLSNHLPCFAPPISSAAQLQILQLNVRAINADNLIGNRDIITVTECDMLQWRSIYKAFSDDTHPDTRKNRDRLDAMRPMLPRENQPPNLDQLQSLRTALKGHSIEVLGPAGLAELHCVQTVLYEPICFALESVPAQRIYNALTALASEPSLWWPTELIPAESFTNASKTVDASVLRVIVNNADRCNLLEPLLLRVSQGEDDPLIRDELRLLQRLQTLFTDAQLNIGD